ncbi:hypothetical protein [Methanoregula sp.]|uniref:hypothetical protein n=1 Tax=Methanoregula sp. TaxID=2052170 RepID=UPI002BAACAC1|nr:hypothetical protein [Methanoregula sp.]HVP96234.1 hypothetical protein [Methanoregula sp.]
MRIKIMHIIPLFLLILVLAGTGCIGTKGITVNKTAPPAILVDYHRVGGIGGTDDRLVIFTNGIAAISRGSATSEIALNDTDLALLSVLFNESDFAQLQTSYPAARQSPDILTYTITYMGKTVMAQDTDVPPSLETIIDKLNSILTRAVPQKTAYPTLGLSSP